ncbi:hypothetical protein NAC44_10350 [Allorhizobium sp. BGMRC 0089]|uniref:hypothetical protein n=1 Tax=Allorhizobium sonneratiae TaxID=2934936 RepID=UPI002033F2D7|nr:hypothetical protein [Allorhizobium sonneratiae]MCM2292722.1 hypothetical protein [Allorhizobium sonneratiae]
MSARPFSLMIFVALLALTMVGEGMITVTLLWTSASLGHSPMFIGLVLFVMNIVPFLAQLVFRPLRAAIADQPLRMIILPRMAGVAVVLFAAQAFSAAHLGLLVAVACCLTFITFISQQCLETLMGQWTVAGLVDAQTSARLSQTALQSGVFVGNALAGLMIDHFGTAMVFVGIGASFACSLLLPLAAPNVIGDRPFRGQAAASRQDEKGAAGRKDAVLWGLLLAMGVLAVQLSGFNVFVPLIFQHRSAEAAALYGIVSAAAGSGALLATLIPARAGQRYSYAACCAVVVGDAMVTRAGPVALTLGYAFAIGFGFNTARIRIRQAMFERLDSKAQSALWGGRVTLTFRAMTAGAPLLFALMMRDTAVIDRGFLFAAIGLLTMGLFVPLVLFLARRSACDAPSVPSIRPVAARPGPPE